MTNIFVIKQEGDGETWIDLRHVVCVQFGREFLRIQQCGPQNTRVRLPCALVHLTRSALPVEIYDQQTAEDLKAALEDAAENSYALPADDEDDD